MSAARLIWICRRRFQGLARAYRAVTGAAVLGGVSRDRELLSQGEVEGAPSMSEQVDIDERHRPMSRSVGFGWGADIQPARDACWISRQNAETANAIPPRVTATPLRRIAFA